MIFVGGPLSGKTVPPAKENFYPLTINHGQRHVYHLHELCGVNFYVITGMRHSGQEMVRVLLNQYRKSHHLQRVIRRFLAMLNEEPPEIVQ